MGHAIIYILGHSTFRKNLTLPTGQFLINSVDTFIWHGVRGKTVAEQWQNCDRSCIATSLWSLHSSRTNYFKAGNKWSFSPWSWFFHKWACYHSARQAQRIENGLQPARMEPLSKRTLKMDIVRHWRAHHWMLEKKLEAQGVVDAKTAGKRKIKTFLRLFITLTKVETLRRVSTLQTFEVGDPPVFTC